MKYEVHVTFRGEEGDEVSALASNRWKYSKMSCDPALGDGMFCYLTFCCDSLYEATREAEFMKAHLCNATGLAPLRLKIEAELHDERYT